MHRALLVGLSLAVMAGPALAQATGEATGETPEKKPASLSVTTGVDYSSGDYGLPGKTKILVAPVVARLLAGDFTLTASVPYIRLDTPGGVVIGPDGQPIPGVPSSGGRTSGFGDPTVGAKYTIPTRLVHGLDLSVGGRVKVPTASRTKGLSTGKTDFTATVEAGYTFGTVSPFVDLGYRWLGDPSGINLRNGPTVSVGSSFAFGKTAVIASYDYARSAIATSKDSSELFGGVAVPVSQRFTLTGYGTKGLSSGSADYGLGLLLTAKAF